MVMNSHQVGAMMQQQLAAFSSFQSYAAQIVPPYAGGSPHGMGYGQPPPMGPMPMGGGYNPAAMQGGFMPGIAGGLYSAVMNPGGYGAQAVGERLVGTGLNAARTVGTGMEWLNMGAGGAAMFGLGGAGMAALGGLPVMAGIMAGGYAINQVGVGFQQRQAVNRVMRQHFGGMMGVGGGRGGTGFGTEEMGSVSTMVRDMAAHDLLANVDELTRVMDKTAQMGLYRGVQNIRDFQRKFRETVGVLKEISQTMGTTLEDAANFMSQGRQMGFFSGNEITANLMRTRATAQATGLSVGQLQQVGQIGAQMGRALGMRGRTGAQALQNMTANIAMGMQMGVLSDEMMYEATGLEGGEAAAAFAQSQVEATSRFLRRGAGRAMTAALWDPETGGINQAMLDQVRRGQFDFRQLRTIGRRNVAQTGGRNSEFFSQIERIAGEVIEQGGNAAVVGGLAEHYARRRGVTLDDPILQRQLRRHLGVSQAEIEANIAEYQNMPLIMARSRSRMSQAMEANARQAGMQTQGIQGLQRRLSDWWESKVENPFREVGDQLTTQVSRNIETLVSDFEGRIKMQISDESLRAYKEMATFGEIRSHELKGKILTGAGLQAGMAWAGLSARRYETHGFARAYQQLTGTGSGGWGGMMRDWVKGWGRTLGTRTDTNVYQQAEALGLGSQHELGFHLTGKRGVAGFGEVDAAVMRANQTIMAGGEQFGFSTMDLQSLGATAASVVTQQFSGDVQGYARRVSRASPLELANLQRERISMYMTDPTLRAAFGKTKTFAERAALARSLEQAGGLAEGDYGAAFGSLGMAESTLASAAEWISTTREGTLRGLSGIRYGVGREYVDESVGTAEGMNYGTRSRAVQALGSAETIRQVLGNEEVRTQLSLLTSARSDREKMKALSELRLMAASKSRIDNEEQREVVRRITSREFRNDANAMKQLTQYVGDWSRSLQVESSLAIYARDRDVGVQVVQSLQEQHFRFQAAHREDAYNKLLRIARMRASGDMSQQRLAENEEKAFYTDPTILNDRELQGVIAATPGLEYLAEGAAVSERTYQQLMGREQRRRGITKVGRLMEMSMAYANISDVVGGSATDKSRVMNKIAEMAAAKGTSTAMAYVESLAREKGTEYVQRFQRGRSYLEEGLAMVTDRAVTEAEARKMAGYAGVGTGVGGRLEGSQKERLATSAQLDTLIMATKKSWVALYEIARNTGVSADRLNAMKTGEHWAIEGHAHSSGSGEKGTP